jgi:DNA-binding MarR family transcriptional regulator
LAKAAPESKMTVPDLQGVDDLSAHVFRAFLGTARMHMQLMMRTLADSGTHPGQAMCLRLLTANDGVSQRDLAGMLHVARPTVTRMLQGMEKAGLVERRPDAADQRLTRVYVTSAGRDAGKQMGVAAAEYVNATIAKLPEDDRRELLRLLGALSDGMRQATGESAARA